MSEVIKESPEGEIRESLSSLLTDANAISVAKEIVNIMRREADSETLEFDFHISGSTGKMTVKDEFAEKNTWFKFDTKPGYIIDQIKKREFEANCNIAEQELIYDYHKKICGILEKNHGQEIEDILKEKLFNGKNAPCHLVKVTFLEIVDFSGLSPEENCQIFIEKAVPKGQLDYVPPVAEELFRIATETGKGFNQIVREKKQQGDPKYEYVQGVTTKKMLWECQIDMFVDYSI